MIKDSRKKTFDRVIVYKLDRFSRNTLDKELYKDVLKRNGVKVESACENIPDDSSGILLEAVLGGVNAWYSADLSEKVKRNMDLNAEKCLSNGGYTPLGYKIVNKRYVIDENTAPTVSYTHLRMLCWTAYRNTYFINSRFRPDKKHKPVILSISRAVFYFYRITLSATIRSSGNSMASFNERGFPDAAAHFPGNGNPVRYRPGTGLDWPDYSMCRCV